MSEPIAYLLTWTCHGTWLHGDPRGSVDDDHNVPGTPYVPRNVVQVRQERSRLQDAPVELDALARKVVAETIVAHCQKRGWELHALNVRTNHVHVVVGAPDATPERILGQLKSWTTRRLRDAGCFRKDAKVWTYHDSTRYLWTARSVHAAMQYVAEEQGHSLH